MIQYFCVPLEIKWPVNKNDSAALNTDYFGFSSSLVLIHARKPRENFQPTFMELVIKIDIGEQYFCNTHIR